MTPYIVGAAAGPLIGLVIGIAVAWFDPAGRIYQARKARAAMPRLALVVSDRPPWCGSCNEFTRLIDSNGDGPSRRCTACHPLAEEAS